MGKRDGGQKRAMETNIKRARFSETCPKSACAQGKIGQRGAGREARGGKETSLKSNQARSWGGRNAQNPTIPFAARKGNSGRNRRRVDSQKEKSPPPRNRDSPPRASSNRGKKADSYTPATNRSTPGRRSKDYCCQGPQPLTTDGRCASVGAAKSRTANTMPPLGERGAWC